MTAALTVLVMEDEPLIHLEMEQTLKSGGFVLQKPVADAQPLTGIAMLLNERAHALNKIAVTLFAGRWEF